MNKRWTAILLAGVIVFATFGLAVTAVVRSGSDNSTPSSWTFSTPTPTRHLGAAPPTVAAPTSTVVLPTWTEPLRAEPGAVYRGTNSDGGAVELAVSVDGKSLVYFDFTGINCLEDNSKEEGRIWGGEITRALISDDKFTLGGMAEDYSVSGEFWPGGIAQGWLFLHGSSSLLNCTSNSITWTADTSTPAPAPRVATITPCTNNGEESCAVYQTIWATVSQTLPGVSAAWYECAAKYTSTHYTLAEVLGWNGTPLETQAEQETLNVCGVPR